MARKSTIKRLPVEIVNKIHSLTDAGLTLDEIMGALDKIDVDVSRSSLHRYLKNRDRVLERVRQSREMAKAIAQEFGTETDDTVARTNIEMLHAIIMKGLSGDGETDVVLDAKEAMFMATALEKVSKASKLTTDRILQIRDEAKKEAMKQASEIVDKAAQGKGLSPEMVNELKTKFLGINNE